MSPSGVFLDTVGLVALWNRSDQWHHDADLVFRELIAGPVELFTTSLVLFECANTALRGPFAAMSWPCGD